MLFLAVSLSFVVDNYRDNYNSSKTSHELASELIVDIGLDTLSIHKMKNYCTNKLHRLDSLYRLIDDDKTVFDDSLIYYYSAHINERPWLERNSNTFALFTNVGYLNSFSKEAALALTKYDIGYKKTIVSLERELGIVNMKIFPLQQHVFHTEIFQLMIAQKKILIKPVLRNWNADNRWLYHNYIIELQIENQHIEDQYNELLTIARQTLKLLKQEYPLDK